MVGGSSNRPALDDAYRAFMDAWNASHPGSAAAGAAANAAVDCADFAPAPDVVRADLFTDDELATKSNYSYELHALVAAGAFALVHGGCFSTPARLGGVNS